MTTSSAPHLNVIAQGFDTGNIGNDIYMGNIAEILRKVSQVNVNLSIRRMIIPFLLHDSLKSIGRFSFPASRMIETGKQIIGDCNLVVLSGPCISKKPSNELAYFVKMLHDKSIPYALLSAGSYQYSTSEVKEYSEFFQKYPPLIFSSRDDFTFDAYSHFAKYSLRSCCTSFFSPINFPRAKASSFIGMWDDNHEYSFQQLCKLKEQLGIHGDCLYRPVIDPFAIGLVLKRKVRSSPIKCLLSSSFYDYLDYYSQTDLMLSSRVHCCAPTIAYGGKAILLNKTGRKRLFEAVGVNHTSINNSTLTLMSLDRSTIDRRYDEFTDFLSSALQAEYS